MFKLQYNCTHLTRYKVTLKILQARLQQYVNHELPDVQVGFRKARGTRYQIANICSIIKKNMRIPEKHLFLLYWLCQSLWLCGSQQTVENSSRAGNTRLPYLPFLRNLYAGQEATVRTEHETTDWFQIRKGVHRGCILSPCLFNLYAEYIMRNAGLEEAQAGNKIAWRNINNLRYADDTTLMAESWSLKLNIQKTKIMASGPNTSWEIDGETVETVSDFVFWAPKSLQMVTAAMKLKDAYFRMGNTCISVADSCWYMAKPIQ